AAVVNVNSLVRDRVETRGGESSNMRGSLLDGRETVEKLVRFRLRGVERSDVDQTLQRSFKQQRERRLERRRGCRRGVAKTDEPKLRGSWPKANELRDISVLGERHEDRVFDVSLRLA